MGLKQYIKERWEELAQENKNLLQVPENSANMQILMDIWTKRYFNLVVKSVEESGDY